MTTGTAQPKMLLMSPHLQSRSNTKFSPLLNFVKNSPQLGPSPLDARNVSTFRQAMENITTAKKIPTVPSKEETKKTILKPQQPESMMKSAKRSPWIDTSKAIDTPLSPSMNPVSVHIQQPSTPALHGVITYCACGQLCVKGKTQCAKCEIKASPLLLSGYLYETDNDSPDKLNRFYYSLMGKDLYSKVNVCEFLGYRKKESNVHDKIYTLAGSFVKDSGIEKFANNVTMHSFSLIFPQKTMKFFVCKVEEKEGWLKSIKQAIGYSSLYDFYKIEVIIFHMSCCIETFRNWEIWSCL